jgi:hypothetical protein
MSNRFTQVRERAKTEYYPSNLSIHKHIEGFEPSYIIHQSMIIYIGITFMMSLVLVLAQIVNRTSYVIKNAYSCSQNPGMRIA